VTEEIVLRDFAGYVAQNRYGPWRGYWPSFWRSRDGHGGCNSHPTGEDAMAALRLHPLGFAVSLAPSQADRCTSRSIADLPFTRANRTRCTFSCNTVANVPPGCDAMTCVTHPPVPHQPLRLSPHWNLS
jgi:hypothetical protein